MSAHKKKRKARRRTLSPPPRPGFVESRLRAATWAAVALGVAVLAASLVAQLLLSGGRWVAILRVAGVGLVIAGFVFGRAGRPR